MRPADLILLGFPLRTISMECFDIAQGIPEDEFVYDDQSVIAMLFSCENNYVRYTFGDTAPNPVTQIGHIMNPGYTYMFVHNPKAVRTFQFCNGNVGQQANTIIHITLFFEKR